jgi:hypothetical protein
MKQSTASLVARRTRRSTTDLNQNSSSGGVTHPIAQEGSQYIHRQHPPCITPVLFIYSTPPATVGFLPAQISLGSCLVTRFVLLFLRRRNLWPPQPSDNTLICFHPISEPSAMAGFFSEGLPHRSLSNVRICHRRKALSVHIVVPPGCNYPYMRVSWSSASELAVDPPTEKAAARYLHRMSVCMYIGSYMLMYYICM